MFVTGNEPIGLVWNAVNYSCAYDSWFTILRSVWASNQAYWTNSFALQSGVLSALAQGFSQHYAGNCTLENARDRVRSLLHGIDPETFRMGPSFISLFELISHCIKVKFVGKTHLVCTHCPCSVDDGSFQLNSLTVINRHESQQTSHSQGSPTISQIICALPAPTCNPCYRCTDIRLLNRSMRMESEFDLLVFELWNNTVIPDLTLALGTHNGARKLYTLRGLVYHGSNHFTSGIVDAQGQVWYHDGAASGSRCVMEGNLNAFSNIQWLWMAHGRSLSYAVYAIHV
jgi:hypothetical protein